MSEDLDNNNQLWQKIRVGNQSAFDQFYKSQVNRLFNYGMKLYPNRELIKDCIQDVFINLWKKRSQLNIDRSITNYLITAFRRQLFAQLKKNPQSINLELISEEESLDNKPEDIPLFTSLQFNQVKQTINQLPRRQKEALFLKYYEHMDYEEICQIMELQSGAVYKLVSKGIQNVRRIIAEKK